MVTRNSEEIGAYLNLGDFLRYRGYVLIGEPLRPAHVKSDVLNGGRTPSEVVKTILTQLGVWVMVAAREEGAGHPEAPARDKKKGMMIIYLLSAGGKPSRSSPDFARLLSTAAQKASENAPPGGVGSLEVVVLASEDVYRKKHLQAEIQSCNREKTGRYVMYPYHIFASVVPEVPIVPRHVIIPPSTIKSFMERFHLQPDQISEISAMDPPVVWIGGRRGDYICVWRLSETAAARFPYIRHVV